MVPPIRQDKKTARKVVFLDRDGVINEPPPERYVRTWREFKFRPGALAMLSALFAKGYRLVVITNQQGVGKGLIDRSELQRIHDNLCAAAERHGAQIDAIHFCPHLEAEGCQCRKPRPGLIHQALETLGYEVDLDRSWFLGDSPTDVEAGQRAGLRTVLLGGPCEQARPPHPTLIVPEIADVARVM